MPLFLLIFSGPAIAHTGEHDHLWTAWNFDPLLLGLLGGTALLYVLGLRRLWGEAGVGRGISRRQAGAFAAGMAALAAALISPLDWLSAELSSAHMVQHMVLMMVAAPLLVVSSPVQGMMWGLSGRWRREAGAALRRAPAGYVLWQPLVVWLIYAVTLWIWHLPGLYQAALRNDWIHDLQHAMFFGSSCLFWRVLLDPLSRLRLGRGVGVVYLFTTSLHATVLGVFMALSPRVWYGDYVERVGAWGLTPLEDQQLAGLIMWMPACMIYAFLAAVVLVLWLHDPRESGSAGGFVEGGRG